MKPVFAATFYFLALLNQRDAAHGRAVTASRASGLRLVTTELVLLELADALCQPGQREEVLALWNVVQTDPTFRLIPASERLIERGRALHRERPDKEWPLTDCVSFVVMREQDLSEALTADHHYEQAGFKPCWPDQAESSTKQPCCGPFFGGFEMPFKPCLAFEFPPRE